MGENIIKVRDDHSPVNFIKVDSDDSNEYRFKYIILIYYLVIYIKKMLHIINKIFILKTNEFTKEQYAIWEEIQQFYHSLKGPIMYAKCKLCKNNE